MEVRRSARGRNLCSSYLRRDWNLWQRPQAAHGNHWPQKPRSHCGRSNRRTRRAAGHSQPTPASPVRAMRKSRICEPGRSASSIAQSLPRVAKLRGIKGQIKTFADRFERYFPPRRDPIGQAKLAIPRISSATISLNGSRQSGQLRHAASEANSCPKAVYKTFGVSRGLSIGTHVLQVGCQSRSVPQGKSIIDFRDLRMLQIAVTIEMSIA